MVDKSRSISEYIKESEEYIADLKNYHVDEMFSRMYSRSAKQPFKVMSFVNAMTWRMYDISSAALMLLKNDNIIPSLSLVRACWENMVATYDLAGLVKDCCEKQTVDSSVDDVLMRILFSNRFEKDNRYVGEEHFNQFEKYKAKNILTLIQKHAKDFPQVKDVYGAICEFVHPNLDGVLRSYSYDDESNETIYFGPQFTQDSWLFSASIVTLNCSIALYINFITSIEGNIEEFSRLCEKFILSSGKEVSNEESSF